MSKFLVAKKKLELTEANNKPKLLVSKRVTEISDSAIPQFSVIKKYSEIKINISFDSCGGSSVENIEVVVGKMYSNLPTPTKTQYIFLGWFTDPDYGQQITNDSTVTTNITKLYAQWELVDIDSSNCTSYEVVTTSSYKNTGIYSATIKSSSTPLYIDWGDGSVEKLYSSISKKSHTYSSVGTFTVKISNNITSFQISYNDSTWYGTTSQNRYTFNKMISTGSNITSLPSYAFYYCQKMTNIDFMQNCFLNVTSLPNYCFYYCTGLTSIQGAERFTSLGQYCFYYCTGLSGTQDLSNFKFTSLTNSYIFGYCSNVKQWILPTGFTGTYFGSYMFYNNTYLSSIILPNSLTSICSYCFNSCSNLKSITIPQNVKTINERAFYNCTNLNTIDYQTTALTSIGNYAFYQCYANNSLSIPDTVKSIGNYAFYYNYNANATDLNLPSQLTSLGTYAYQYCYNLKNLTIPSALTSIGDYAFAGCYRLSSIVDNRLIAQTVGANTFGNTTEADTNTYTGYNSKGNNILCSYVAATGYEESYWNDPLQNPDKCGFQIQYIDPENIKYCNITFNAGNGSVSESTKQVIQNKKLGSLPTLKCPVNTPHFGGWFTQENGQGERYTSKSIVPQQDELILYAYYSDIPFYTFSVDLNNQWRESTSQTNPDPSLYSGVYESNSNYHVDNGYAKMYIRFSGFENFTIYIRSYAESSYDYTIAMNLDVDVTSNPSSSISGVKAHTSGNQQSGQAIGNYKKVEYTNIDGEDHFICVIYRKDYSVNSGNDRGYLLIEGTTSESDYRYSIDCGNGILLYNEDKSKQIVTEF